MLLGTLRAEGASAAAQLAHTLQVRNSATALELAWLDRAQVTAMVQACLDGDPAPPEVDSFVGSHADGVPLFIEELLTGLATTGALFRSDDGWMALSRLTPRVPLNFGETVTQRCAGLASSRRADLDAWQERLTSLDVTFTPVVDVAEGGIEFSVIVLRDPDNIQLELCWSPAG